MTPSPDKPKLQSGYVNVYAGNEFQCWFKTREDADKHAREDRIGIINLSKNPTLELSKCEVETV